MARLTVEDCLEKVGNRYELTLLASKRARQLSMGAEALIEEDSDKPTVIALREIAEGLVTPENIKDLGRQPKFEERIEDIRFSPAFPSLDDTSLDDFPDTF